MNKKKFKFDIEKSTNERYLQKNKSPYTTFDPYKNGKLSYSDQSYYEIKLRQFNYSQQSVKNLEQIQWDQIQAIELSEDSSEGVSFIETIDGAFVLKGIQEMSIEYFIYKLCLTMQIPTPQMRLIKYSDLEFQDMITQIEKTTLHNEILNYRIKSRIDILYLAVMEYIPSITIQGMGIKRANIIFDNQSKDGRDRLIKLGQILQFDSFINNYDRYPLLWENDGNANNIIVKVNTDQVSSQDLKNPDNIDLQFQNLYAIDHRMMNYDLRLDLAVKNFQKYLNKLEDFLNQVFIELQQIKISDKDFNSEIIEIKLISLNKITSFIQLYTGYELNSNQILWVLFGIIYGCINLQKIPYQNIIDIRQNLYIDQSDDWMNIWNNNLNKIDIEAIKQLYETFQKYVINNQDIIQWVQQIIDKNIINHKQLDDEINQQVEQLQEINIQ